jgi:hypothetical protein
MLNNRPITFPIDELRGGFDMEYVNQELPNI